MSPFLGGLTTFSGNVAGAVPQGSGSGVTVQQHLVVSRDIHLQL